MKKLSILVSCCLLLALGGEVSVQAQERDDPDEPFTRVRCLELFYPRVEKEVEITRREGDLPLAVSGIAPTAKTAAALVASEKDGRGVVSFSRNTESTRGMIDDWTLSVSTPFSKDEGEASIVSLSGVGGDIVASGSFTRFIWNLTPQRYAEQLCRACDEARVEKLIGCSADGISERLQSRGVLQAEAEARAEEVRSALFGVTLGKLWGMEASIGRKERTFFESDTTKKEEDREGYSFALFGGWNFNGWSSYGRITGKRGYKENGEVALCSPVTGSVLEECSSLPFGEAQRVESLVGSAELRRFYDKFAISPSAEYDFESGIWGFQLPIFLLRNKDRDFTGGFKFSWRTDEEDLVGAVFVGVPLGL